MGLFKKDKFKKVDIGSAVDLPPVQQPAQTSQELGQLAQYNQATQPPPLPVQQQQPPQQLPQQPPSYQYTQYSPNRPDPMIGELHAWREKVDAFLQYQFSKIYEELLSLQKQIEVLRRDIKG